MTPAQGVRWAHAVGARGRVRGLNSGAIKSTSHVACARRPLVAVAFLSLAVLGLPSAAQTPEASLSPEQLEILRSLPEEERNALIESVLGTGDPSVGTLDRRMQFPETVFPRTPLQPRPTQLAQPDDLRFKAEDTFLIALEVREFAGPEPEEPVPQRPQPEHWRPFRSPPRR